MYTDGTRHLMIMILPFPFDPPEEREEDFALIVKKAKTRYLPVFEKVGCRDPVWIAARPHESVQRCCGRRLGALATQVRVLTAAIAVGRSCRGGGEQGTGLTSIGGGGLPIPSLIPVRHWEGQTRTGREGTGAASFHFPFPGCGDLGRFRFSLSIRAFKRAPV